MIRNEIKIIYKEIIRYPWNYLGDTVSDIIFFLGIVLLNIGNNGLTNFETIFTTSIWFLLSGTIQSMIYSFEILIRNSIDSNLRIYGSLFKIQLVRIIPWFLYKLATLTLALLILFIAQPSIQINIVFSTNLLVFIIFNFILLITLSMTFSILCAKKTRILTVIGFVFYSILFIGHFNDGGAIFLVLKYMPILLVFILIQCVYIVCEKKWLLFD